MHFYSRLKGIDSNSYYEAFQREKHIPLKSEKNWESVYYNTQYYSQYRGRARKVRFENPKCKNTNDATQISPLSGDKLFN